MGRALRFLVLAAAVLAVIPLLLAGAVLIGANTDPGRRLIEALAPRLTGNTVRIEGLAGRFPDALRIRRLMVSDPNGVWLTVNDAALDWSPRRLIQGELAIDRLEAGGVTVDRMPAGSQSKTSLRIPPLRAVLSRLRISRLKVGSAVSGEPIVVAVQGAGELAARDTGEAHLAVNALTARDGAPLDHYLVELSMDTARLHATLNVAESAHGLLAGLARLPDLGGITIAASADGALQALATKATIEAGPLHASLDGTVDAVARAGNLGFSVRAPAMTPRPGVGWAAIRLEGNVHGPLRAPEAKATVAADGLTAGGAGVGSLRAHIAGDATGTTAIQLSLDRLRVPGPSPEILAGGPLTLDASVELAKPGRPFRFTLRHPLFSADGTGDTNGGQTRLTVPDLAPLSVAAGVDLRGHTELDIGAARAGEGIELTVKGTVGITSGIHPVPVLVGDAGTIDLAASVIGRDVRVSRFSVSGSDFNASVSGQFVRNVVSADWSFALDRLTAVQPGVTGTISAHGHADGSPASLSLTGDVTGDAASNGQHLQRFSAHIAANGLPDAPEGRLTAGGTFLGAPLDVAIDGASKNGGFHLVIGRASWKSLTAGGTLDLASGAALPTGAITLSVQRLADLTPILGNPIAGAVTASITSTPGAARIKAVVTGGGLPAAGTIAKAALDATITIPPGTNSPGSDPMANAVIEGGLTVDGVDSAGVRASARMAAKGALDGLDLTLDADTPGLEGMPAHLSAAARLNASARTLAVASLRGTWGKEPVRLLAPARISFAKGVALDRLRLGFRQGELVVGGRWGGGGMAVDATLTNLPADIIAAVAPEYAANGTIAGEARLTGHPAQPVGTIRISASGLRLRTGPGRALPPVSSTINATLRGTDARLDARLTAGRSGITMGGLVPLRTAEPLNVRVGGTLDLAMLRPLLAAQGRDVRGRLELDLGIGGTPVAPRASGTVRLVGGEYQDAGLGAHVTAVSGVAQADGDLIRLERFAGTAGPGTIALSGTVGLGASPMVDLSLRASNARILSTDLATALIDANLTLRGALKGTPVLAGTVLARSANIQVPERLPASIVVLPVREAGAPIVKPPPPSAAVPDLGLNLTLDAPAEIYVRGRGVDAELGGTVVFAGTALQPLPHGSLHLRRGTFSVAGQTLNLTEGTIDFAGGALTNPTLNLVATSTSSELTATLTITGDVRDPKIVLSSVPDLPQDEILSQLLFNSTKAKLNPFQVAEIAAALASMSGVGGSVTDPLGKVRSVLGLDQLSVGSDANGGTTLQAGRYLARGVRVGATQSASGGGSQATVEIDLAKGLKLETTAGTGSASATPGVGGNTNGSGVGLLYQFEY